MKVERWTTCDEVDERSMPESIGGMGGWVHGHTWYEYLDAVCLGKDDPKLKYTRPCANLSSRARSAAAEMNTSRA